MSNWPTCKYRDDCRCEIASLVAGVDVTVDPTDCYACKRYPIETNEVTLALARAADPTLSPENSLVGTNLAKVFSWFIPKPPNCECPNRAAIMDAWGPQRCLDNQRVILGWLRESALDNGYPYSEFIISSLLRSYLRLYIKG